MIMTSFLVDNQWYDMPRPLVLGVEKLIGREGGNRAIVEFVKSRPDIFKIGPSEGTVLLITRRVS